MEEHIIKDYKLEGQSLEILTYPDKILTNQSQDIELKKLGSAEKNDLALLIKNMLFTMYHAPGIGLAAPQIGKNIRLFVVDTQYSINKIMNPSGEEVLELSNFQPMVFINPKIIQLEGLSTYQEGCLSLPEIYEEVERPQKITIEYLNIDGEKKNLTADGLLATCIQHEHDHLNGIVFIDHISMIKKKLLKKKLIKKKQNRQNKNH